MYILKCYYSVFFQYSEQRKID